MPKPDLKVIHNSEFDRSANTASAIARTASVAALARSMDAIGAPAPTQVHNLSAVDLGVAALSLGTPLLAATEAADMASFVGNVYAAASTHDDQTLGDDMAGPTREEVFNAKLETADARVETRFVELSAKLDRVTDALGAVRDGLAEVRTDNKKTRTTIIITVVASTLAALAALWTTQQNLLSAFQAGLAIKTTLPPSSEAPRAPPTQSTPRG